MGWRCVRVRRQLALLVGDDLPEREKTSVESHLTRCAGCREHRASLERSREALAGLRAESAEPSSAGSLWPALRDRLASVETSRPRRSWFPAGAMLAASIAMAIVLLNKPAKLEPVQGESSPYINSDEIAAAGDSLFTTRSAELRETDSPARSELDDEFQLPIPYFHLESARPVGFSPREF